MKIISQNSAGLEKLYQRNLFSRKRHVEEKVRAIIEDIRLNGDDAVLKYTRRFDKARLKARQLRVAENEISGAYQNITTEFITHLKTIINNVTHFYKKQIQKPCRVRDGEGVLLKETQFNIYGSKNQGSSIKNSPNWPTESQ